MKTTWGMENEKDVLDDASEFIKIMSRRGEDAGALFIYKNIQNDGIQNGLNTLAAIVSLLAVRLGKELDERD